VSATQRYLIAGAVTVVAIVVLAMLWRVVSSTSIRRLHRDLADVNPRVRIHALKAAGGRELRLVADDLVVLVRTERDPAVLAALTELLRDTAWQPADAPAIVELRAWAQLTTPDLSVPAQVPPRAPEPAPVDADRGPVEGAAGSTPWVAEGPGVDAGATPDGAFDRDAEAPAHALDMTDAPPADLPPADAPSADAHGLGAPGEAPRLVESMASSTQFAVGAADPTQAPDLAANAAQLIASITADAAAAIADEPAATSADEPVEVGGHENAWAILEAPGGLGAVGGDHPGEEQPGSTGSLDEGAPDLAALAALPGVAIRRGDDEQVIVSVATKAEKKKSKKKKPKGR
jgi:hypothetical protein